MMTSAPPSYRPPSPRALVRSAALAMGAALLLVVCVVLPAEAGLDPAGVGRWLGLTQMGEIKAALAQEATAEAQAAQAARAEAAALLAAPVGSAGRPDPARTDTVRVALRPGEHAEVKLVMRRDAHTAYRWSTDRGLLGHELHGLGLDPDTYRSYRRGAGAWSDQGELTAAFDGLHGWYWENRSDEPVIVTLYTEGAYLRVIRSVR